MATIEKDFGRIDILVNNAGIVIPGQTETYSAEAWDKVFDVDCRGVFLLPRETIKVMLKNGYGRIINIASDASSYTIDQTMAVDGGWTTML